MQGSSPRDKDCWSFRVWRGQTSVPLQQVLLNFLRQSFLYLTYSSCCRFLQLCKSLRCQEARNKIIELRVQYVKEFVHDCSSQDIYPTHVFPNFACNITGKCWRSVNCNYIFYTTLIYYSTQAPTPLARSCEIQIANQATSKNEHFQITLEQLQRAKGVYMVSTYAYILNTSSDKFTTQQGAQKWVLHKVTTCAFTESCTSHNTHEAKILRGTFGACLSPSWASACDWFFGFLALPESKRFCQNVIGTKFCYNLSSTDGWHL